MQSILHPQTDIAVSVLMPVYNGLPLVKASVESLLRQTMPRWECVIVDDGSTDGTGAYLDTLTDDERFRVFHFDKNQGRPAARQKSLDEARGEYIAMLDAGDLYHPRKLELQLAAFVAYPGVALVGAAMCSFGTASPLLRKRGAAVDTLLRFDGHVPNHASSMLLAERAKTLRYNPKMSVGQDRDFLERYLRDTSYVEMHDVLYYYSEFDSVTKRKIRKGYKKNVALYAGQHRYAKMSVALCKLLYAYAFFPLMSIEHILARRGVELNEAELNDFNTLIHPMISKSVYPPYSS